MNHREPLASLSARSAAIIGALATHASPPPRLLLFPKRGGGVMSAARPAQLTLLTVALTVLALAGALFVIYYEKFLSAPAGLPGAFLRRGWLIGLFALLGMLGLLALTVSTANAQSDATDVPQNWALVPDGLEVGDRFRLLFATSGTSNAESSNISDYNTFVQNAAANGHAAIRAHSSGFRVVASTTADDANDNTSTNYLPSNKGVPIYWLGGNKLADDYQDFYDGDWDDESNPKDEDGDARSLTDSTLGRVWTGSNHNGTKDNDNELGASGDNVRFGQLDEDESVDNSGPIQSGTHIRSTHHSLYGLSEAFRVVGPTADPPTGLTATASGDGQIDLDWSAPANDGGTAVTGYRIEVSGNGSSNWSNVVANTGSTATEYSHAGLPLGATRHYRVSAINANGISAPSNVANATNYHVPDAPTGLTATAKGSTQIDLDWSAPASDGGTAVTGYRIEVSGNGSSNWSNVVANTRSTATEYSDTELNPGNRRYYRVSAINAVGRSGSSDVADATTHTIPGRPTGLSATANGSTQIDLDWSAPSYNGGTAITGYRIEHTLDGGANWSDLEADTGSAATEYSDTGLPPGATRYYRVSAINAIGASITSDEARASADLQQMEVPDDWALIPADLGPGHSFRLLFVSAGTRNAYPSNIVNYNAYVQAAAAAGHAAIQDYSSGFRAVGSTRSVDARDNTATTHTADDQGVPIYWLGGNRLADDYADFYDGTWDDEINATNASGGSRPFDSSNTGNRPFTGSNHNGTGDNPNQLGRSNVRVGRPDSGSGRGPINGLFNTARNSPRPFYGLSAVLRVAGEFTPALSIGDDAEGDEGGNVTFTVALSPVAAENVTATWTASVESGDTAAPADDLTSATGTLTVRAGEATGTFAVRTAQDITDEENETFTVTLSGVSENALLAEATAQGTILDDDEPPVLSVTAVDAEVTEGESATFTLMLAPASGKRVVVPWNASSMDTHTATPVLDYPHAGELLIFLPGEVSKTVTVPTIDDAIDESDQEIFALSLGPAINVTYVGGVLHLDAPITILDNDDRPTLSVADVSAEEGYGLTFTVTLSAESGRDVTVDWTAAAFAEAGDSATAGTDFTADSGTLTFTGARLAYANPDDADQTYMPGETEQTFTVATTEDATVEMDETFTVALLNPSNAEIGDGNAKGTIENDDVSRLVSNTGQTGDVQLSEATFAQRFTIGSTAAASTYTLAGVDVVSGGTDGFTAQVCTVNTSGYPTSECTDLTPPDTFAAGTMSFAAPMDTTLSKGTTYTVLLGATVRFFEFAYTTSDSEDSGKATGWSIRDEYDFRRAGETGWNQHDNRSIRIAIKGTAASDTPAALPTLSIADADATEGDDMEFTVTLSAADAADVTATWTASIETGDTAVAADLGTTKMGTVTVAMGNTTGTFTVSTVEDSTVEVNETFTVTLTGPSSNAQLSSTAATAQGTINNDDLATVSVADAEGDEDEGVEFTLTLSAAAPADVTVDWTASIEFGNSASTADLATTKTGTVTITKGATTKKFTVPVNADTTDESDQTFTVTLSNPTPTSLVELAADPTAEGTIDDDDDPPTLTVADLQHDENDSSAAVLVSLSEVSEKRVRFRLRQVDRTEDTASDADWSPNASTAFIAISAGNMSGAFWAVSIVHDTLDEDDETLTVEAYNLQNATGSAADREATITIVDDDPTPTVTVADASATEGDKVKFVVTLSAVSGRDVEVGYATSVETGDTAVSGTDFTEATGTLTILAADSTDTGTVEVQTTDDDASESAETFTLTLSATKNVALGTPSTATGTINDETVTLPTLSVGNASATEGALIRFPLTLSAAASENVTVSCVPSFGSSDTAVAADLTGGTSTTTIFIGATSGSCSIRSAQDTIDEEDETFTVTLSNPSSNAQLATDPTATGTILDDDTAPTVTGVAITSTPVLETDTYGAGETIRVTVTFSEAVTVTGDPEFAFSLDSGEDRAPYKSGSGTTALVFAYTVAPGDEDDDGIFLFDGSDFNNRVGPVTLDSDDAIKSTGSTTDADLAHTGRGTESGHKVDGSRSIVSVEVTSTPQLESDTYGAGETILFTVTFTAKVDVTGDPVLEFLFDGSEVRQASDVSGDGTTELVFSYTVVSGDDDDNGLFLRDESDYNNPDGPVRLDSDDEIEFHGTSTDAPLYWAGRGTQSGHKVDGSRTTGNVAPSFSSSATISVAENETAVVTVAATDSDADDDVTGYAITGGADQAFFSIGATSGALTFDAAPNYEDAKDQGSNNTYVVEVTATSGAGTREKTATQTITVTVTDVSTEAPGQPGAPTVSSTSATSLSVNWSAPTNTGPAITDYDVQYRAGNSGDWSDGGHVGTATTATLTGLSENTSYQVQVRATNDEGMGAWSDAGSGATDANAAPSFSSSETRLGVMYLEEITGLPTSSASDSYVRGNRGVNGLWSDGSTLWVADGHSNQARFHKIDCPGNAAESSDGCGVPMGPDVPTGSQFTEDGKKIHHDTIQALTAYNLGGGYRVPALDMPNTSYLVYDDLDTASGCSGTDRSAADPGGGSACDGLVGPEGVWSDGDVVWVSDRSRVVKAYRLTSFTERSGPDATVQLLPDRSLTMPVRSAPRGIWSDGTTIWVVDAFRDERVGVNRRPKLVAFDLDDGTRNSDRDVTGLNGIPEGVWSDGVTLWVSTTPDPGRDQPGRDKVLAYEFYPEGGDAVRDENRDLRLRNHRQATGLWSDGEQIRCWRTSFIPKEAMPSATKTAT